MVKKQPSPRKARSVCPSPSLAWLLLAVLCRRPGRELRQRWDPRWEAGWFPLDWLTSPSPRVPETANELGFSCVNPTPPHPTLTS